MRLFKNLAGSIRDVMWRLVLLCKRIIHKCVTLSLSVFRLPWLSILKGIKLILDIVEKIVTLIFCRLIRVFSSTWFYHISYKVAL